MSVELSRRRYVNKMNEHRKQSIQGIGSIDRQTRRELILERLREAISSGQLEPGTHLAEIELSEALGVSRGTLREALRHLQQEGLIVGDARGRLTVRVVTAKEVREIFSVRAALESLAFAEVCAQPERDAALEAMRVALRTLEVTEGDYVAQLGADLAFHETLCLQSGNATLHQSWLSVSGLARAAVTAAGPETALHNMAIARHSPLLDYIATGDLAGGQAYLVAHMNDAADRIIATMAATEQQAQPPRAD